MTVENKKTFDFIFTNIIKLKVFYFVKITKMGKDSFSLEELESILNLKQEYLRWRCEGSRDWINEYHSWYAHCLKDIARALWLNPDYYGTPSNEEDEEDNVQS